MSLQGPAHVETHLYLSLSYLNMQALSYLITRDITSSIEAKIRGARQASAPRYGTTAATQEPWQHRQHPHSNLAWDAI